MTLDAATGQQVGSIVTGSATSTDLSPHVLAFQADHEYVVVHTHPSNTSFSNLDVRVLAEHPAIRVMVVVGVDGIWYVMTRGIATSGASSHTVEYDYLVEFDRLGQAEVPIAERPHLAMEHIAARHGWLYDRVSGSSDESAPS